MEVVSDNYVNDPNVSKQSLIQQRNAMEVAVSLAQNSLKSIDGELNQLKAKYSTMVPFDAGVQNFERDADLATKEYMDALGRYNQSNTEKSIGLKLQIAQIGLPGPAEPSKKIIYMGLSGVSSIALCFLIVLGAFFTDKTVNNLEQLNSLKIGTVIGNLNFINADDKDARVIWENNDNPDYIIFKDLMRSLRFEITDKLGVIATYQYDANSNKI
ncbi:MAG: lipopolysaccharide biosynthesis protein, partial [Flavobacterium sp.]